MIIKWKRKNQEKETIFDVVANEVTGIWFKDKEDAAEFATLWLNWLQTGKHFSVVDTIKPPRKIKISTPDVDLKLTETLAEHLVFYGAGEGELTEVEKTFAELPLNKPLAEYSRYQRACSRVLLNHREEKLVIVYNLFEKLTIAEKKALQVFEKRCQKATIIHVMSDPLVGKYCQTLYGQNKKGEFLLVKRNEAK